MGIFDKLKNIGKKPEPEVKVKQDPPAPKPKKKTAKEIATENGEPYVAIVSVELDPENIGNGAFELDWNDKFLANLVRAGYQSRPNEEEHVIVDRWFQTVCRNVVMENYEQWEANQISGMRSVTTEDIGGGKSSIS